MVARYIYIYIYVYMYMCRYLYTQRDRESGRERASQREPARQEAKPLFESSNRQRLKQRLPKSAATCDYIQTLCAETDVYP